MNNIFYCIVKRENEEWDVVLGSETNKWNYVLCKLNGHPVHYALESVARREAPGLVSDAEYNQTNYKWCNV